MRELIRKLSLFAGFFILFSAIINLLFFALISRIDWDLAKRIETRNFENPEIEVIALGSSLANYGFDSHYLNSIGIESYNLALTGGSLKTSYVQIDEYLTDYKYKPKIVALLTNSTLEDYTTDDIVQPVVEFTMKGQKINLKDIPLSKFQWQTTELIKRIFSREIRESYVESGQIKRYKKEPDISVHQNIQLDIREHKASHWMGEIAKRCSDDGVELVIIEIPGVEESQNVSEFGPYNIEFLNGYNCLLYNFNSQLHCEYIDAANDWAGLSHFNMYGAEKFTRKLIEAGIFTLN